MRMFHYFAIAATVAITALLVAAGLGLAGQRELHFQVALPAAILVVGAHTLMILFMIITGRILREAIKSRDLGREFLDELNVFFADKAAYPAAILSAFFVVIAGVLAYGAPGLGLPSWIHWLAGSGAVAYNLWAIPTELRALRANQRLVDRASMELDRIDAELVARGEELPAEEPLTAEAIRRGAAIVALSAWFPYLYWALVVWRGDFSRASLHPWAEVSALAAVIWWIARREARRAPSTSDTPSTADSTASGDGA